MTWQTIPPGNKCRQSGFSLVTAIFILVILAALGAVMLTLNTVQTTTVAQTLQAARAFQAARAGLEWSVVRAVSLNAATVSATCGAAPSTPTVNAFSLSAPGLDTFSVSVTCSYTRHQETSKCFNVYRIASLATSGTFGDPFYVSRQVYATVTDDDIPGGGSCP